MEMLNVIYKFYPKNRFFSSIQGFQNLSFKIINLTHGRLFLVNNDIKIIWVKGKSKQCSG